MKRTREGQRQAEETVVYVSVCVCVCAHDVKHTRVDVQSLKPADVDEEETGVLHFS